MQRLRLRITGRVQGVCYRANACKAAQRFGVTGWVRNLKDGSVEAELEGLEPAVQAMRAWCQQGPAGARVDKVEELPPTDAPPYDGFEIV